MLRRFSPFVLPLWPRLGLSGLLIFAGTAVGLLKPWPLKFVFDRVLNADSGAVAGLSSTTVLTLSAIAIAAIAVLDGMISFLRSYITSSIGQKVAFRLRVALYTHLHQISLGFHDRARTGDLIIRLTKDVDGVRDVISNDLVDQLTAAVAVVSMIGIMLWVDWQLGLVVLAFAPLLMFTVSRYRGGIRAAEGKVREGEGMLTSLAQEAMNSVRLVRAYGREEYEVRRFQGQASEVLDAGLGSSRLEAGLTWAIDTLTAVVTAALVGFGAHRVLSGHLTPGELLVFISYLRDFYRPVNTLSKWMAKLTKFMVRAKKIVEVMDEEPGVRDQRGARRAPSLRGRIEFRDVSFGYHTDRPVLRTISLAIQPGQVAAIIGPTGAGKSTLASLIPRLYDPQQGQILIDGQDVREFTLASLRDQLSLVLQSTMLFHASALENVAYGRPGATRAEIIAAAQAANVHDVITGLPEGYDTNLGERGDTLSGGQRQRIAIARALIRNAPILILDEPTTGLDAKAEQLVLEALEKLMAGKTTVFIAHKLSTVRRADVIFVLDKSRIVEQGTHQELLALGGHYAELYRAQIGVGEAVRSGGPGGGANR